VRCTPRELPSSATERHHRVPAVQHGLESLTLPLLVSGVVDVNIDVVRFQRAARVGSEDPHLVDEVDWPAAGHDAAEQFLEKAGGTIALHGGTVPYGGCWGGRLKAKGSAGQSAEYWRQYGSTPPRETLFHFSAKRPWRRVCPAQRVAALSLLPV
jgi:hypothetical protein